jgi:hypothetical protein
MYRAANATLIQTQAPSASRRRGAVAWSPRSTGCDRWVPRMQGRTDPGCATARPP